MRLEYRKIFSILILALFILWVIFYIRDHLAEFNAIFDLSLRVVGNIAALLLLDTIILGFFNKVLMHYLHVRLKFSEWYGLTMVSTLWNYVLPFRGGAGVRAFYLKKIHNFTITDFLGTMLALYFVSFFVNAFIGLLCITYIYLNLNYINFYMFCFFLAVFLGGSVFILFSPQVPVSNNRILKKISQVINAWYKIRTDRVLVFKLTLIILAHALVDVFIVYNSFLAYGISLSLYKCLLISTLFAFSILIKITPGSLGTTEALMIFSAQIFQITPAQSLLAAGLIRVVNLLWIFSLGALYSYLLGVNVRKENKAITQT